MNNQQKRKYMTDALLISSYPFMSEIEHRNDFLKSTPSTLYKYRCFDKYTFEMISENYAFLSPVNGLDDPFDCLNDFNINDFYNPKTKKITSKALDFILKQICPNGIQNLSLKEVKKLASQCIVENGIDYEKVPKVVTDNGVVRTEEVEPLFVALNTFNENFQGVLDSTKMDGFVESAYNPGDKVGVCSLSELRDNKVMWSLYGKKYKGYCIEYDIPKTKQVIQNLCPVIYTKKNNNRFIEKILEYSMAAFMRSVTDGNMSGNIGAAMELFCTKDKDWSYQREWRLIGGAADHFNGFVIKNIYLGFKVTKNNESKMKTFAKKYGFGLFKMNPPNGDKKIKYTKLV